MHFYDFTIRFDDKLHTLTAKNGLDINQVGELLNSLSKALNAAQDEKIVLSEIKGNCYALNISTNSITKHEDLKVIHGRISHNDYLGLNSDQRRYASKLKMIMADRYTVQAYDESKSFKVYLSDIKLPQGKEFYYEISSLYGTITSIGGKAVDGKAFIHLSGIAFDIQVTPEQERALINYYKAQRVRFLIHKKISIETGEVRSAVLQSFEVMSKQNIYNVSEIRDKYSDLPLSDNEQD